jgi:hypothetical protein
VSALLQRLRRWFFPTREELDQKFLVPALERAADKRGLQGAEREAAIAKALEIHRGLDR